MTLAPKLNGANLPSRQPAPGNNASRGVNSSNTGLGASKPDQNVQPHSNNYNQGRAGFQPTTTSTGVNTGTRSVAQQPPPPALQFNPFSKGFSGLGANVLSNLGRPSDQQPVVTKSAPKPTTTSSVNPRPDHGWHRSTTSYSTDSSTASPASTSSTETPVGIPGGNLSTTAPAETSTFDADISFGGDEFLLEGDELALADLMNDLDQVKDNVDDEDTSLSWSPTPPKIQHHRSQRGYHINYAVRIHIHVQLQTNNRLKPLYNLQLYVFYINNIFQNPGQAFFILQSSEDERRVLLQSRGIPFNKDARLSGITSTSPNSSIKKKMRSINQGLTDSMFETKPWKDMLEAKRLQDYKPSTLDSVKGSSPLVQVTISDIENRQHRGKIPWLVAIIKDFTPSEIDADVTLMDPSGEMKGTVHNSVLEQYKNNEIRIGTVLVLNNVSLFSPTPMSHYIIITLRNIAGLYVLPTPTSTQSQGSSQDRSQKKRRTLIHTIDSQEGTVTTTTMDDADARRAGASLQSPVASSHQPTTSRQLQQASPDWGSTPEGIEGSIRSNSSSSDGIASQEQRRAGSSRNNSEDQSQERRFSPYSSQKGVPRGGGPSCANATSQPKEVMFQSLRQTLGSSMMPIIADTQTATPMITLGGLTPSVDVGGGFKSLSSFAASPTLRKRSSQSGTSQRSNSSGSGQVKNNTQGATSQRSHRSDANDSLDWPDDFPLTELDGALDDEPSETRGLVTVPAKRGPPSDGASSSPVASRSPAASRHRPAPAPSTAAAAPLPTIHDDGDEDDLDHLLDGIDEAELFNLL
ncbi:hypothetical protein BGW39_001190 [Mortierella sp. 14UC]|nr:hypothetical protein BGW39_001190 [Mortierella sp. 14UC]